MNICVKYCGGCNPRYERKEIVDRLKEDFKDINIISQSDNKMCDLAVIIAGCNSACVNHEKIEGKYGKIVIRDLNDYETLNKTLTKLCTN